MKRGKFTLFMLAFSLLLAACNNTAPTLPAMPTDEVPQATVVLPEPTPTAVQTFKTFSGTAVGVGSGKTTVA